MYLIDQELSAINQLSAIVAAISGYLCSKQFGQLCEGAAVTLLQL